MWELNRELQTGFPSFSEPITGSGLKLKELLQKISVMPGAGSLLLDRYRCPSAVVARLYDDALRAEPLA